MALGAEATATLGSRYNLARITAERGDLGAAAEAYSSLAADARRILPSDSRHLLTILAGYGDCLARLERTREAAGVLQEALTVGSASVGEGDRRLAEVAETLARLQPGS